MAQHSCRVPLKELYDIKLTEYSKDMAKFMKALRANKKLTMKEKIAAMDEESAREEMQINSLPYIPSQIIEPGIAQLEALTASYEWHMTIVDVKMTTKQTPQGKKSRFSSMVMVGNLQVCLRDTRASCFMSYFVHMSLALVVRKRPLFSSNSLYMVIPAASTGDLESKLLRLIAGTLECTC